MSITKTIISLLSWVRVVNPMRNPPALPGDHKSSNYAGVFLGVSPSISACIDAVFPWFSHAEMVGAAIVQAQR